jgi:DNA-binding transcriptional LysR family regulator
MDETISLDDLRALVEVARHGGFTAAAAACGVPKATLSRVVARLEAAAGSALLHRTTRRVGLTPAGAALVDQVQPALDTLALAVSGLRAGASAPGGLLRVSTTPDLAVSLLAPVFARLLSRHAALRVEAVCTLRVVDLVAERVDAALRVYVRPPDDPGLAGRKLRDLAFGWYASPAYLARRGAPRTEADLAAHDRVGFDTRSGQPRVLVDDPAASLAMARAGLGLTVAPRETGDALVARGELARVLPELSVARGQLWLVWPTGALSANVAALRDAVAAELAGG